MSEHEQIGQFINKASVKRMIDAGGASVIDALKHLVDYGEWSGGSSEYLSNLGLSDWERKFILDVYVNVEKWGTLSPKQENKVKYILTKPNVLVALVGLYMNDETNKMVPAQVREGIENKKAEAAALLADEMWGIF
jgi:hypothetical protein